MSLKKHIAQGQEVWYDNQFKFDGIQRMYVLVHHHAGQFKGWHGHKEEAKYALVFGTVDFGFVFPADWEKPSGLEKVHVASVEDSMIYIPSGVVLGIRTVSNGAKIIFFSYSTMEEIAWDDYRYPEDMWVL